MSDIQPITPSSGKTDKDLATSAAGYWAKYLENIAFFGTELPPIDEKRKAIFKKTLAVEIENRMAEIRQESSQYATVSIGCDYEPKGILKNALDAANIPLDERTRFPSKMATEIYVSEGVFTKNGGTVVIFPEGAQPPIALSAPNFTDRVKKSDFGIT